MKARTVTLLGILAAVALILGYLEQLVALSSVPGVKLGLSNTVLLYALYLLDAKRAWLLMALKVLLSGLLFSGAFAMLYGLFGGIFSLFAMCAVRRIPGVGVIGVSVCGAVAHNLGQLLIACFVAKTSAVLTLLPVLLVAGALAGVVTGAAAKAVFHVLKPSLPGAAQPGPDADQPNQEESDTTEVSK